jgi:hypothetical protein
VEIDGHYFGCALTANLDLETLALKRPQPQLESSNVPDRKINWESRDPTLLHIGASGIEESYDRLTFGGRPAEFPMNGLPEMFVQAVEHTVRRIYVDLIQGPVVVEGSGSTRQPTGTLEEPVELRLELTVGRMAPARGAEESECDRHCRQ